MFFIAGSASGYAVFFAILFLSVLVMLYVSFPSFDAAEQIAIAAPIDWRQVLVGPDRALARLGAVGIPVEMQLGMTGSEPDYRIVTKDGCRAVSARTGAEIRAVNGAGAGDSIGSCRYAGGVDQSQRGVTRAY